MATKKVHSFRCPLKLLACLDQLTKTRRKSRSKIIAETLYIMNKAVKRRKGYVIPPITGNVRFKFDTASVLDDETR